MTDAAVRQRHVLLIAAHGSSTDQRARDLVHAHAARIAARVPHDVTVVGFARGAPSIADAVHAALQDATAEAMTLTVLPFMTSAGHYARQVLPVRVQEAIADRKVTVHTAPPVGASRAVGALLHQQALRLAAQAGWRPSEVSLLLIGHGTRRQSSSRDTANAHARRLATLGWGSAQSAFIDDDPQIAPVVAALPSTRVIVLPFLIGGAAHHLVDIPVALGIAPLGSADDAPSHAFTAGGRRFILAVPIGLDPALGDVAASIASRAWQRVAAPRPRTGRSRRGSVTLVGAGPGAADLITVRGRRALRQADVVVHDRLVAPSMLAEVRPDARLIDVGKHADTPQAVQEIINETLIAEARAGHRVVRLKGGDPFVFGRGSEEMEACAAAGIRVRVVPGLSSALAAPALAGIPVTARHVSRGFAVVTASTDSGDGVAHIDSYAAIDTLVVLMGRARMRAVCDALQAAGRDADTPVACIERATLPEERVVRGTLRTIADDADTAGLQAPMVMVIGATAAGMAWQADVVGALAGAAPA